jgi:hypothetical protein
MDTVLPDAAVSFAKTTTIDVRLTSSDPLTPVNVSEFVAIDAVVLPSYSFPDAVNEPPMVTNFCEILAVVVGAPTNDNE